MGRPLTGPDGSERTSSERPNIGSGPVGFGASIPGMKTAPVEHVIKQKTRAEMAKNPEVWQNYNALSRLMRIINRGTVGPMAGRAFAAKFDGQIWPEGADAQDESTWLQPGEYMDVPKEVAWHFCGEFLWNHQAQESKRDIINRYGDWEYEGYEHGSAVGRNAKMVRIGMPPLPDLIVCELGGRGQIKAEWKVLVDIYLKGERLKGVQITQVEADEPYERVKQPA